MRYRRFGKTALTVSEIGFGCARLGGVFQGSGKSDLLRLLRRSLEAGITFFDTADMYTQGESERLLGEAFRRDRHKLVIATKVGYQLPRQKRVISRVKPLLKPLVTRFGLSRKRMPELIRGGSPAQDFSPGYIARAVDASLRRLQTDYIDVYQLHSPPTDMLERGEFVPVLEDLTRQGKVRYWGVACEQPEDALLCMRYASLSAIQVALSVLESRALDAALPQASARGLGVIVRQVFASGLLMQRADQVPSEQLSADRVRAERKRLDLLQFEADSSQSGRSRTELALEYVLKRSETSVALVGMHRESHLSATLEALDSPLLVRPTAFSG